MTYGTELIRQLEAQIELMRKNMQERYERISDWQTDIDDCFISQRCEDRGISVCQDKISLIRDGGYAWFPEYATLDGQIVNARWCDTRYGCKLRAEMPDGSVVWTTADTAAGLARKGLKKVLCKRPAWFAFRSSESGMLGVYSGDYVLFPSSVNYATGENAGRDPVEVKDPECE